MSNRPGPAAPFDELRVHWDTAGMSLASDERLALLETLLEAGHPVTRGAVGERAPLALLSESEAGIAVVGVEPTEVLAQVTAKRESAEQPTPGAWTPWFPVIDFARCTNCMQCLSFCLFDVYGVDEAGQITVRNEEKCKTSCPACSRVCPEVAILFPKYAKGPINGAEVKAEDITAESMKVDISALLGGDIYAALRDRSSAAKKRFSTERDESKALLERKRCLKELKDALDIPDEVLMTLPSAGDIEERTRRAKAKMEKRMQRSQSEKDRLNEAGPSAPSVEEWDL